MPSDPSVWFAFLKHMHLKPFKMIFKSSWMVLFSFTISAFIKKSTSFFFQKVNWKNLSRKVRPGKRIRSSQLFLCIIVEFIHQKKGQQTQEGDVADMALWHQVSFPLFPRQKASSSSHKSTTCWWWTLPTFILPSSILPELNSPPHCTEYSTTSPSTREKTGEYNPGEDWKTTSSATNLLKTWSGAGHPGSCCQHNLCSSPAAL